MIIISRYQKDCWLSSKPLRWPILSCACVVMLINTYLIDFDLDCFSFDQVNLRVGIKISAAKCTLIYLLQKSCNLLSVISLSFSPSVRSIKTSSVEGYKKNLSETFLIKICPISVCLAWNSSSSKYAPQTFSPLCQIHFHHFDNKVKPE